MELLVELIFQLMLEFFGEAIFRWLGAPFERKPSPVSLICGYIVFGLLGGLLSIWLLPTGYIPTPELRLGYLLVAPIAIGFVMLGIRNTFGREKSSEDSVYFAATAAFAFFFALVRHLAIY